MFHDIEGQFDVDIGFLDLSDLGYGYFPQWNFCYFLNIFELSPYCYNEPQCPFLVS